VEIEPGLKVVISFKTISFVTALNSIGIDIKKARGCGGFTWLPVKQAKWDETRL